jgi:hypothetical protein
MKSYMANSSHILITVIKQRKHKDVHRFLLKFWIKADSHVVKRYISVGLNMQITVVTKYSIPI